MNDCDALAAQLRRARRDTRIQSVHLNAVESALTLASRDRQFAEMAATTLALQEPRAKVTEPLTCRYAASTRSSSTQPGRPPAAATPNRPGPDWTVTWRSGTSRSPGGAEARARAAQRPTRRRSRPAPLGRKHSTGCKPQA